MYFSMRFEKTGEYVLMKRYVEVPQSMDKVT